MGEVDEGLRIAKREIILGQRFISFLTLLLFPFLLSLWVELAEPSNVGPIVFWLVVITIAGFQIFAFLKISKSASETAPNLLMKYLELEQERDVFAQQEWRREREVTALTQSVALSKSWSAIQAHLEPYFKDPSASLKDVCRRIINPLMSASDEIFGFEAKDRWSIVVYRWNEDARLLEAVYWDRERDHPSSAEPRSWKDGEGHSGTAFMAQQTLFTTDMAETNSLNRVLPSPANQRRYDTSAYRSFATAPLTITDHNDKPKRLGVVALTSNQLGRFDEANIGMIEQLADVLGQALWMAPLEQQIPDG